MGESKRGPFGGLGWVGLASQVNVVRVVPNLLADMGYARQSLQERERGAGDGGRTVDGGCEKITCADRRNEISRNVKILP